MLPVKPEMGFSPTDLGTVLEDNEGKCLDPGPESPTEIVVVSFFRFVNLSDCRELQPIYQELGQELQLKGTVLLAEEGINATLAGSEEALTAFLAQLSQDERLRALELNVMRVHSVPFQRWKVKVKSEIVTLGQPQANPLQQRGVAVAPEQWNQLLDDPEVVVIDTRNAFEVSLGSFEGAINPQTRCFREFPQFVAQQLDPARHRKVAMFCTGGIRCEKASAYLLSQGFAEVYQLQGGILNYLNRISPEASRWRGDCFVFDERVSLGAELQPGQYQLCPQCGQPFLPTASGFSICADCGMAETSPRSARPQQPDA